MSKKKTARDYWYSDVDIMQLLMEKSENHSHYKVIDSAVYNIDMNINIDSLSIQVRANEALEFLNNNENITSTVIPISPAARILPPFKLKVLVVITDCKIRKKMA